MPKIFSEPSARREHIMLHGPTMGTLWSASVDADARVDPEALRQGLATAVQLVDQQMSPWKHNSDLMRLNRAPVETWVDLPSELLEVLNCALDIHRLSAGAFDPGVGALVDAWGFGAVSDVPDAAAIHAARQDERPNTQALKLDRPGGRAKKRARLQLDLCGIAKGYAVDLMVAVLKQHGVEHALVALDGELRAVGSQASGEPWAVALERPEVARRAVHGVIELQDLAVATSGDYRRSFQVGALRLAHTMDARRAAPVNNTVASVTVLASSCMHADAWATALLVAGPGEGLAMAQRMGLDALFLLRRAQGLVEMGLGRFGKSTEQSRRACETNESSRASQRVSGVRDNDPILPLQFVSVSARLRTRVDLVRQVDASQ